MPAPGLINTPEKYNPLGTQKKNPGKQTLNTQDATGALIQQLMQEQRSNMQQMDRYGMFGGVRDTRAERQRENDPSSNGFFRSEKERDARIAQGQRNLQRDRNIQYDPHEAGRAAVAAKKLEMGMPLGPEYQTPEPPMKWTSGNEPNIAVDPAPGSPGFQRDMQWTSGNEPKIQTDPAPGSPGFVPDRTGNPLDLEEGINLPLLPPSITGSRMINWQPGSGLMHNITGLRGFLPNIQTLGELAGGGVLDWIMTNATGQDSDIMDTVKKRWTNRLQQQHNPLR